jgi:diaminohydroxyphosphoribosylaminopyrimidine deaminase/5-amino-6-(5-phosphoribosylamino)uracil reductase
MLLAQGRPWVIGKWAMTLDGKIATRSGDSRWISNEQSRAEVHGLRGRVDAILVGRGTVERDDPLLTARPAGPRVATRVVLDRRATAPIDRQLFHTPQLAPTVLAVGPAASPDRIAAFATAGCQVWRLAAHDDQPADQLRELLAECGRRRWTNLLVEGGGQILGAFHDAGLLDEVHAYIAPRLIGGNAAPTPLGGLGLDRLAEAASVTETRIDRLGDDTRIVVRFARPA